MTSRRRNYDDYYVEDDYYDEEDPEAAAIKASRAEANKKAKEAEKLKKSRF